jgi:hypothetical protein
VPSRALSHAIGMRVQRLDLSPKGSICLELFGGTPPQKHWLALHGESLSSGCSMLSARPSKDPQKPPALQKQFRKELVPTKIVNVELDEDAGVLTLRFQQPGGKIRQLRIEASRITPRIVLTALKPSAERVLATVETRSSPLSKKGSLYSLPTDREEEDRGHPSKKLASAPFPPKADIPAEIELQRRLKKIKKRCLRLQVALKADLGKHQDCGLLYQWGEMLKPFSSALERGLSIYEIPQPNGPSIVIPLDSRKDGKENLKDLFRKAKRSRTAREKVEPRMQEVEEALAMIDTLFLGLGSVPIEEKVLQEALSWVEKNDRPLHQRLGKGRKAPKRKPYRAFRSTHDALIWVGRKASDNTELTFHRASGNDTWLHVRGSSGSHVIVKNTINKISADTLIDAAHLAVWFSAIRGVSRAEVQYTERKHVRNAGKGSALGLVYISQERVMYLAFDEGRLKRILESEHNA